MIKTVKVPFEKIEKIAHISDIHIRNLKRHKEYRQVFRKVYAQLKSLPENSVILLSGDIAHSKLDMSPELIQLTSEFFTSLAKIRPVILIAGNHDCNLSNTYRLDALSPIVKSLNNPNLHYLKESGVYTVADIDFVVMSVFDDPSDFIKAKDVKGKNNKVALYHGSVENSQTDIGFHLKNADVNLSTFNGYDMVLLGDIHKRQCLQKFSLQEKLPEVWYPGSLIQQNHGENLDKGLLIWNVKTRKPKFYKAENDYGYFTLTIQDGVPSNHDNMPKKPRLRVQVTNTTASEVKRIITEIRKKRKIKELAVNKIDTLRNRKLGQDIKVIDGDVRDPKYQNELITDYLVNNYLVDEDILKSVRKINKELNLRLSDTESQRNIIWKPIKFEFDNMFSYGGGNVIDFTNIRDLVGLFSPNHTGKSSFLDSMSYCLFDKCSRAFRAKNVMNNKKDRFYCKLTFEINGQIYVIERKADTKKDGNVRVKVNFWTYDENGDKELLNGDQRRDTDSIIRSYIGNYEDFILTSLSTQNNGTHLIDRSQSETKDLFAKFLDLQVFEELYELAALEVRDIQALLSEFRKQDFTMMLADIEVEHGKKVKEEEKLKKTKKAHVGVRNEYNKEISRLNKKLVEVGSDILDIDVLQDTEEELKAEIKKCETQIKSISDEIETKYVKIQEKINNELDTYDIKTIERDYKVIINLESEKSRLGNVINTLKIEVKHKLTKLKHLESHEYDPDCKYCMNNVFVKDAIKTREVLKEDKDLAETHVNSLRDVQERINSFNGLKEKHEKIQQLHVGLSKIKYDKSEASTTLHALIDANRQNEDSLKSTVLDIETYKKNKKAIETNRKIEQQLDIKIGELRDEEDAIDLVDEELRTTHARLKVLESEKDKITENMDQFKDLEEKFAAFEYYLDAVKRNGVSYDLISKAIPYIEQEVNNILSQLVEFRVNMDVDGKNINIMIVYDEQDKWPLDLSSGMEKFVASLAIRVALINISSLPKSNFLAIDEGFSALDADNINSLYLMFDYLRSQFDFMLNISHLDVLRDMVNGIIEIKREKGFSYINHQ